MKSKLNMDSLTKPELLMLFSILEGELEARDMVIDTLKAQRKDVFIQERYGRYDLSDPFLALQRDGETVGSQDSKDPVCSPATSNPLVVLKLVVSHCRRMQEKMLAQLAAAESRHRMVIADLEEEKRKHAEDTAEGDDVTYILEKERERLHQQLEFERGQVRRLEKEQRRMSDQLEEERAQHKQLSCALAKECKWASARALEEGHRLTELSRKLEKEREACQALKKELEEERRRALRMEARVEEQLAEFDTEREQLRSRLKKEEAHCHLLQRQVEELQSQKRDVTMVTHLQEGASTSSQVKGDPSTEEDEDEGQTDVNGHHCVMEGSNSSPPQKIPNGNVSPGAPLCSSPCASPVHAKCPPGGSIPAVAPTPSAGYQSPYQAGINQRFHAARHKFQSSPDLEPAPAQLLSPKDAPPASSTSPPPESIQVKQMARSTVTQALSRFTTVQQAPKLANNSPFGTDYRCLAAPLSPVVGRATAPQGVRSPTIPRADRGNPPPIPPKKPGLVQAPPSPASLSRSAGHCNDAALSGSCGLTSSQDGVKELDVVVSSN
ncbi:CTTNBP2 N-terminal-like protein isoform X2 [Dunckerocampus dactyliophorus]|uniref:CTTNBP2 N-terminal-like protein isoform X2 n=1 Tax=Dunckerocampus dactyliophorus TaxID=161453 RepID=UPI0024072D70|nr:CTTNBP2 N-terminal-like protein isoform X2 [Dunckerocampus dactyliophorus]